MLLVNLDARDARPLYLQIMDEVRRALVVGTLRADDPVPSVRELAAQLVVNPRTVLQAYQELEREGVLYVRRGQGTFIAPDVRADRHGLARDVAKRALLDARRSGLSVEELIKTIRKVAAEEEEEPFLPASTAKRGRGEMSGGDAVATHALSKRYGRETALDGVNLRVPDGAVYVLVGANGAGKSTTLKVLMNLERADAGTAEILGLDTVRRGAEARAQVGYVPERTDHEYGWMTCGALLAHVAAYYPAWDYAYADRLTRAFGLRLDHKVGTLSKGESRRLQLVLALAHRPPVLLLDEPTDGLDPVMRHRTLSLLAEHLADAPTTILVSTHQIHELESLADHVGVLRDGRLVAQMSRDELQRTVGRYRVEVPEGWQATRDLLVAGVRANGGREAQWTLVGDQRG